MILRDKSREDEISFSVEICRRRNWFKQAYRLVFERYVGAGYLDPGDSERRMRYTYFNALPRTQTFVGLSDERCVSTMSLVEDSQFGLPMDSAGFKGIIDKLRAEGKKVAEITMLATSNCLQENRISRESIHSLIEMSRMAFHYGLINGVTDLCIAVNPSHVGWYKNRLFFVEVGDKLEYPGLKNAPAVPLRLEVRRAKRFGTRDPFFNGAILQRSPDRDKLTPHQWSEDDLKYFFSDLLRSLDKERLDFIKSCYPDYDFGFILNQ